MRFTALIPIWQKRPWNKQNCKQILLKWKIKAKKNWKQRLLHEFTEYWINVVYMALFFSAVILYRRLLLAEHGIIMEDYFAGVLKALVIAKVIMIGSFIVSAGNSNTCH